MWAMALATLAHARSITLDIVRELDPLVVIVFGAVAREGSGNDVDLLIVVDDATPNLRAEDEPRLRRIVAAHSKTIAVDPFLMGAGIFRAHFRAGSPFLNTIVREGRPFYMKGAESQWADDAKEELAVAKYLVSGQHLKAACYHAQQAVEKCLKGRLLAKGWELEKVHSVARLASLCADHGIAAQLTQDEIAFVDSIYRGRYPGEAGLLPLGDPTQEDAARAVRIAEGVIA